MDRVGTVAIVGVGLIGGSVGLALKEQRLADCVVGVGRDARRLAAAEEIGAIDTFTVDPARGVADADVVVVCTPVTRIADDVKQAAAFAPAGTLITDAGSTKRAIVEEVEQDPRASQTFVAAHPIAGSERQGAAHGRPDLFAGRVCVLTPTARTPADRVARAHSFWAALGSRVVEMAPDAHDEALALTSHLPHAIAAALAGAVPAEALPLAAGAYRDVTRVAAADATLWTAIFRANRLPVLRALDLFQSQLSAFQIALTNDDDAALRAWWETARDLRRQFEAQESASRHP